MSKHYNDQYFLWQSKIGEFGGWANLSKFAEFITETDHVLDFGCGGGYLLKNIACKKKVGIEVNPTAIAVAKKNKVEVYSSSDQVPGNYVNVVISNNALEHTLHPLKELKNLYKKLVQGGKIIFYVPCESISYKYQPNDINHHLYSWGPMCLGNLFSEAGFKIIKSEPYIHKWPPQYRKIAQYGGRFVFDLACRIYGRLETSWYQVRIIAEK